jgi:hypothetical protein
MLRNVDEATRNGTLAPSPEGNDGQGTEAKEGAVGRVLSFVLRQIDEADDVAAVGRVADLRDAHPDWSTDQLAEHLIRRKCQQAAAVGAVTAGSGLIPGIGTLAALTVGTVADIGATLKLQTELVLELAAVHGRQLSVDEKRRVLALVSGLTVGRDRLLARSGARLSVKLTEQYAQRWVARAIPFAGVAAAAGIDVLSTYLVGRRAHAYFALGPDAVTSWTESLRALSGVDERRLASWLGEGSVWTGSRLRRAAAGARDALANATEPARRRLAAGPAMAIRLLPLRRDRAGNRP